MPTHRVLLHVCCANCMFDVLPALAERNLVPVPFFFNPNIQPLLEYRRRRKSFLLAVERLGLESADEPPASPDPSLYFEEVDWLEAGGERCPSCYRLRLRQTARTAAKAGLPAFLSTLQVSPLKHHQALLEAGREAARAESVEFMDLDLRDRFGKGSAPPGFHAYKQQYCGCLMSEYERFAPTRRHLLKGEAVR